MPRLQFSGANGTPCWITLRSLGVRASEGRLLACFEVLERPKCIWIQKTFPKLLGGAGGRVCALWNTMCKKWLRSCSYINCRQPQNIGSFCWSSMSGPCCSFIFQTFFGIFCFAGSKGWKGWPVQTLIRSNCHRFLL